MPHAPNMRWLRQACPDYPSTVHCQLDAFPDDVHWLATEKVDGANAAIFLEDS